MQKHKRAKTVKQLIEHQEIKLLSQIFEVIPVSVVAHALSSNHQQLLPKIKEPGKFRMNDILLMASYFEIDEKMMIDIVYGQIIVNRAKRKKK